MKISNDKDQVSILTIKVRLDKNMYYIFGG